SSARTARRLRVDRRDYLRTSCGMATAFASMNQVFGDFFSVTKDETTDPLATDVDKTDYFIFDVQTHHVVPGHAETKMNGKLAPIDLRRTGAQFIPDLVGEVAPEDLYLQNYIKEVFLDSETDVACITGVPAA